MNIYRWKKVYKNWKANVVVIFLDWICFEFSARVSAVKSEAMNQRFHLAGQYCTELQEQLSEANNKISRAVLVCLFFSYYNYIFTAFAPTIFATILRKKRSYLPKCGHWRRN